jgi:hypothetical protein
MPIIGVIASSAKGAPGIPTIGTATNVGTGRAFNNGAATVTFTPGAGATATSFTATSSPGGFTATGASSPLTVTGLQSSTSYTFTVTATNAAGTSAASAASNSITATTVPQAPTIGTAADGGTGTTATVTYTANATGGAAVSAYTATSSPGSLTGTGTSPITVSGLTTGTAYTFTVTATNVNGTSLASAASNSVTPVQPTAYESIATIIPNGSATTITFSSIPSTYKHLQLRVLQYDNSGSASIVRVNGDSGANYSRHRLMGDGASIIIERAATTNHYRIGFFPALGPGCASIIDFMNYASTTRNKVIKAFSGWTYQPADIPGQVTLDSGSWMNTAAVTSISFVSTQPFNSEGVFSLYGIKGT